MRLLILDDGYPSKDVLYGDVFVHSRVKSYLKYHECLVVSLLHKKDYIHEGVSVKSAKNVENINEIINDYNPDITLVHFAMKEVIEHVILNSERKFIIWVHGYEALGWYRRLFNMEIRDFFPRRLAIISLNNFVQLKSFRKLIYKSNNTKRIYFVFVSKWMKGVASTDTFLSTIKNYSIIPNPIDSSLFEYNIKSAEDRKKILLIRTFETRKYANDLAVKAIENLSSENCFKDLEFRIFGKGKYFKPLTERIQQFSNVQINNQFIPQVEIPSIHSGSGVFLCPTRQDAQGVSMCEAMSSGLVPITSNNTAIPEFVSDGYNGILTKSAKDIANGILFLYNNPDKYEELSKNAHFSIIKKAGLNSVIEQEVALFSRMNNQMV